ncbi:MAG: M20/M25/M40 family metallo-hydrolase [Candidatus Acidiferrales bacterium]
MNPRRLLSVFFLSLSIFLASVGARAQSAKPAEVPGALDENLRKFVSIPAISGYEKDLGKQIQSKLASFHPAVDNIGNITVTIGSGAPHRLIVTPLDEPGFVVSQILPDGYLHVQRLPQFVLPAIFNELYSAQPVKVRTSSGKWIDGVVAGLSVHLQPGHTSPPKSSDLEEMYVDIGANSAEEARKAGVDNLSPIVITRQVGILGYGKMAAASIGDRYGAAAIVEFLHNIDASKITGTLTVAFVVQQWAGARGLQRILTVNQFDEMIYVGRLLPGGPIPGVENVHRAPRREPGTGVLIGVAQTDGSLDGLPATLKQLADTNKIPIATDYSTGLIPPSYLAGPAMPAKWAHIGIAASWPDTPAEIIDSHDLVALEALLDAYAEGPGSARAGSGIAIGADGGMGPSQGPLPVSAILKRLVETYAVSRHEGPMREEVTRLLPKWAKPETDDAGNLIVHVGTAPAGSKTPKILVVAHMDEIGIDVKSISKDGRLEADWSGGEMSFYAGHQALVHTSSGDRDAIYELPNGWDEPKFEWPRGPQARVPMRIDVGARSPEEVEKLGIKVGDSITIPKTYRPMIATRAIGRSFDDRVGCTALISALWALGGPLKDREVTFVFSTGEELGLVGAGALAKRLSADGKEPDYVFAVDTFVSSDSPLENKRFGDAQVGKGFVVRAIDNSNIVPHDLVEKVVKLARANQIPVQFGVTGGGNDGSAFTRYGPVDVALGWPLRYSHSPAEVVDTRDVEALAHIVAAISKSW